MLESLHFNGWLHFLTTNIKTNPEMGWGPWKTLYCSIKVTGIRRRQKELYYGSKIVDMNIQRVQLWVPSDGKVIWEDGMYTKKLFKILIDVY